jgi:hypothetical protein
MALVLRSPMRAKALVDTVGSHVLELEGVEQARAAAECLFPRGTCLSRALAIAAALPDAEVVIGAAPEPGAVLRAHAWLEIRGTIVETTPNAGVAPPELARLRPRGCRLEHHSPRGYA